MGVMDIVAKECRGMKIPFHVARHGVEKEILIPGRGRRDASLTGSLRHFRRRSRKLGFIDPLCRISAQFGAYYVKRTSMKNAYKI